LLVETPETTPPPAGSLTVLVMGVDARPGQPIDIQVRADSLSVVHVDPELGTCRMLSIPRDTRVLLPGYGFSKVNHALAIGGVPYQQLVVSQYLGVEIDHYGLIDFAGLVDLVDAVGGVTVENTEYAFNAREHQFPVGTLDLSGEEALSYVGFRDGPDGEYGRQKRQQQVARALLDEATELNIITALPDLLAVVRGHSRTDMNGRGIVDLAEKYRSTCTADSLETASLEGTGAMEWDDLSGQELSFVNVEDAEVQQKVAWLFGSSDAADAGHLRGWGIDPVTGMLAGAAWYRAGGKRGLGDHRAIRRTRDRGMVRTQSLRKTRAAPTAAGAGIRAERCSPPRSRWSGTRRCRRTCSHSSPVCRARRRHGAM
jgi:LCP family protein required for cell wall assembly